MAESARDSRGGLPTAVERSLDAMRRHLPGPVEWRARKATLIGIHLGRQVMRDDVPGLAAELAYRFFLALFPFAIFLTAVGGFIASQLAVQNPAQAIVDALGNLLPASARELVVAELRNVIERQSPQLISLSVLFAIFFATGGSKALIKAMNRAYDVAESRSIWQRYLVGLAMTLIAGTGLVLAFLLIVPLRLLAQPIAQALGVVGAAGLLSLLGPLLGLVLVVVAVSIAFRIAPNIKLPIRALLPGAILFAIAWLVLTLLFGFYVSNFGSYANTYGALAGVVILLIWFYASAIVLLVAAEINEVIHRLTNPEDLERRREESEEKTEEKARDRGVPAEASEQPRGLRQLDSGLIERIEEIGPSDER